MDPLIDRRHELVRLATLEELALAKRPLAQQRQDNNKRYALQAPEVECIATGKVPKRFDPTWWWVRSRCRTIRMTATRSRMPCDRCSDSRDNSRSVVSSIWVIVDTMLAIPRSSKRDKNDGLLQRNYLKGAEGDAINVILCGAGHNLRLVLRYRRTFCLGICSARSSRIFSAFGRLIRIMAQ